MLLACLVFALQCGDGCLQLRDGRLHLEWIRVRFESQAAKHSPEASLTLIATVNLTMAQLQYALNNHDGSQVRVCGGCGPPS
jgi:hypothetical protein